MLIKIILYLFIGYVYTQLFKRIFREILKTENVQ